MTAATPGARSASDRNISIRLHLWMSMRVGQWAVMAPSCTPTMAALIGSHRSAAHNKCSFQLPSPHFPQWGWVLGTGGTILHTDDGGMNWKLQTVARGHPLNSVTFVSPQSGWAVGDG